MCRDYVQATGTDGAGRTKDRNPIQIWRVKTHASLAGGIAAEECFAVTHIGVTNYAIPRACRILGGENFPSKSDGNTSRRQDSISVRSSPGSARQLRRMELD